MSKALTLRQERYIHELIAGKSQRQAYREAYSCDNMSDAVVDVRASELLKKGKVSVRYNELRGRLIQEAEDECIVTAKDVLRELAKIAFANITDFLEYKTVQRVIDYKDGEPVIDWAMMVNALDSSEVDGSPIQEVSVARDGTFKFKLYSKLDALEKIMRHLGMFDKPEQGENEDRLAALRAMFEGVKK